ncbi:hypothetical protein [Priestia taiwanensis]|uniref:Coiled-coil domain-containing protein 167 n=1 Tax=Priestia taiwanensis TaxID=1347902 RepID=A0A917ALP5_9BACI|nr:hypothetical protein [Priestia taiwanensis]MBM7362004.1 hypothetical protein [Priestia taiwanensis]GGE58673.1 hypothetical protein GCM10007140_06290 [Priestia taiwanensis]
MEKGNEKVAVAVLKAELKSLSNSIERIESFLLRNQENALPRSEAELKFKQMKDEINEIKNDKKQERSAKEARFVSWCALAVTLVFSVLNYMK